MRLTFFRSNLKGNEKNCLYPIEAIITSAEELREVVKFDHVCAKYNKYYRSSENFISSDVIVMDCDNDHTEDPKEWITPEAMGNLLPDVSYAIATSRNNLREKNGKKARPRFHIYFSIIDVKDAQRYVDMKVNIQREFPFFDSNALDAGRFIYGAEAQDIVWHEGWLTIDELIKYAPSSSDPVPKEVIPAGQRNNTPSRFAGRVVKRYGVSEKAHDIFWIEADRCDPPLDEEELTTIWNSATKFAAKVQNQEGYVPPEDYNSDFKSTAAV